MKIGFDWPSSFGEDMFENGGRRRRTDDEPAYTISSHMSLKAQVS